MSDLIYPFSAIVGQDNMRLALILNAVNPAIGGVLIRGEKGTAKSTAVRGLAAILPAVEAAAGCPYPFAPSELPNGAWEQKATAGERRAAPLVNLPLGVSEDRLLGTLDLERALQRGEKRFEPGLMAQAHQGILYIDEVNLLNDHIVDVLLDTAAMGVNRVEREGVSVSHPAQFILVGTMNPEEGELRPQLLDRFGLAVDVVGSADKRVRTEVVKRRLAFEANPAGFAADYAAREERLAAAIEAARTHLAAVIVPDDMLDLIAEICIAYGVDGMRADLVIYKTARTLAAWESGSTVGPDHVRQAAELALLHRQRKQPFDEPGFDQSKLDETLEQHQSEGENGDGERDRDGDRDRDREGESAAESEGD